MRKRQSKIKKEILKTVEQFYENLYKKQDATYVHEVNDPNPHPIPINEIEKETLELPITKKE